MQHVFERLLIQPFRVIRRVGIERLDAIKIDLFVLAYRFAIGVDIRVSQNSEQPGLDICSRLKTIKEAVGFEQRLLHQILGLAGITRQTQGGAVERVKMLERHSFEFGLLASRSQGSGTPFPFSLLQRRQSGLTPPPHYGALADSRRVRRPGAPGWRADQRVARVPR